MRALATKQPGQIRGAKLTLTVSEPESPNSVPLPWPTWPALGLGKCRPSHGEEAPARWRNVWICVSLMRKQVFECVGRCRPSHGEEAPVRVLVIMCDLRAQEREDARAGAGPHMGRRLLHGEQMCGFV